MDSFDEPESIRIEQSPRSAPRTRGVWIGVAIILLAGLAWLVWWRLGAGTERAAQNAQARGKGQAVVVQAATAEHADIRIFADGLGTVTPLASVTVRTQISGQLVALGFREGQEVRKGDFLAQIDPRPYQIALEQAEGNRARDEALLANARVDLGRYQRLFAQDSIARQQVDTQASLVRQYDAAVQTDRAAVDAARLNLEYCRVVSPIDGRVGLKQVDAGNYVQPSDANGLVVITQTRPITVVFALPEHELPQIVDRLATGAELPVSALDRTGARELATGHLLAYDNQVDVNTGTIKFKAIFDNAEGRLFPNQFVNARLLVDTVRNSVVVPRAGVQRGADGSFVYAIGEGDAVKATKVKLGPVDGDRIAIASGLDAGTRVVTDGTDRLRDGTRVTVPPPAGAAEPQARPAEAAGAEGRKKRQPDSGQAPP